MKSFEYDLYEAVGIVDLLANGNANIDVVGYVDRYGTFTKLSPMEAAELFPPKSRIFAHNFMAKNHHRDGSLVCLSVKPNEKVGVGLDDFIWDKSEEVYDFGIKLKKISDSLTDDGETNYSILADNNLLDHEDDIYFVSSDKIYRINGGGNERIIPYWNSAKVNTIKASRNLFIADQDMPDPDGTIDITNDDQLVDWFMKKVLKPNWKSIVSEQTFKHVDYFLKEALLTLGSLDSSILKSRTERLQRLSLNFTMTIEELELMAHTPWIEDVVKKSVAEHAETFLREYQNQQDKKLKEIEDRYALIEAEKKEEHAQKLTQLLSEYDNDKSLIEEEKKKLQHSLDDKKLEAEILDESIETKKSEIEKIDDLVEKAKSRRSALVEDFSIIKEVLGSNAPVEKSTIVANSDEFVLEHIEDTTREADFYNEFKKSVENTLKANNIKNHTSVFTELLPSYNILLFPKMALAQVILFASRNCYYLVENVNVSWKSFADLWNNGLRYIVNECPKNPKVMHYLILQNINMSYLPNYMQPLIDMQSGLTSYFPKTKIAFPNNLRILCTISGDEVIPLNKHCMQFIGCIDKNSPVVKDYYDILVKSDDNRPGFLTPDVLVEEKSVLSKVSNFYKSYIEDEQ